MNKPNLFDMICSHSTICLLFIAIIIVISTLSVIIHSGYYSDDSLNSLTRGILIEENVSLANFTYDIVKSWITSVGRFYPLAWYVYALFYILNSLLLYKLLVIMFIVLDIIVFSYFIYIITESKYLCIMSILLTPVFFQMRYYHDPMLGFHLLLQLVFLYFILSLIFLVKYLNNGNKLYFALSILLFLMDLMTYEITYPFVVIYIFVIYLNRHKEFNPTLHLSLPYILASCGFLLITISLRTYYEIPFTESSNPYALNLNATNYVHTLAKQIYAAFPMSYYISNPHSIYANSMDDFRFLSTEMLLIVFIYFIVLICVSKKLMDEKPHKLNHLLLYGILLLVLPAIVISFSPKYQSELAWGIGYLPVYISYFGLILISVYIIYNLYYNLFSINANLFKMAAMCLALAMVSICALNYSNNYNIIERFNSVYLYPRDIAEMSMNDGIFNYVPNGSILVVDSIYPWDQPAFYLMYSGTKFKSIQNSIKMAWAMPPSISTSGFLSGGLPRSALVEQNQGACLYNFSNEDNVYYFRYHSITKNIGYVILGSIEDLYATNESLLGVTSKYAYIYVRDSSPTSLFSNEYMSIGGRWKSHSSLFEAFRLDGSGLKLISQGKDWKLYLISRENKLIDSKSLYASISNHPSFISIFPENSVHYIYGNASLTNLAQNQKFVFCGENDPIYLNENYSIEILIQPYEEQVAYAAILGNHPGNGCEGFVIQQNDLNQNEYMFVFGNGTVWFPNIKFNLIKNKLNDLLIRVRQDQTTIYLDGKFIDSINTTESMKNTDMPLYIGNWIGGDRPFNGIIKEIKIINGDQIH